MDQGKRNAMKKLSGVALAAVAASLFVAGCATQGTGSTSSGQVACVGVNGCKGLSDCKSAHNACKGQNTCKGTGFVFMGADECTNKGGKVDKG